MAERSLSNSSALAEWALQKIEFATTNLIFEVDFSYVRIITEIFLENFRV